MNTSADYALNEFSMQLFSKLESNTKKLGYSSITDEDIYKTEMAVRTKVEEFESASEGTLEKLIAALKEIRFGLITKEQNYRNKMFGDDWARGYYNGRLEEIRDIEHKLQETLNELNVE